MDVSPLTGLDLDTKVSILAGQDMWTLPAVPEIGLRSIVMSDGPIGVRGTAWSAEDPSIALPSPTALAATWDVGLARTAGRLLGQEARRKGVDVLLAPTVNLHRSPRGGRHFECYSEDPVLTGEIGASYVAGVQEHSVAVTVKHYVANDSETDRFTVDVRVDDRTLRELYLAPFERIVRGPAGAWGVMSAYNTVNGTTMTEHGPLQNGILKREWGFDGVVVSDWTAARSTVATALGGLDLAMPAMGSPWGEALVAAVRSGAVPEEVVDEMVRRVLRLAGRVGALDGVPPAVPAAERPAPLDGSAVAREIASRSFVLARNEGELLPLAPPELGRIALIGGAAKEARILGGGSAFVYPPHVVSPLDGLRSALPSTVDLRYELGADAGTRLLPLAGEITVVLRGAAGTVLHSAPLRTAQVRWVGTLPVGLDELRSVELRGRFTPESDGTHRFGIAGIGEFTLTIDGVERYAGPVEPDNVDPAAFLTPPQHRVDVPLPAGKPVEVALTQHLDLSGAPFAVVSFALGHGGPRLGPDEHLDRAARVAAKSDVAVVVVATTEEVESEGFDRTTLALPGRQDELVSRVAAANPRTVVVVNAGSPVLMPWLDEVAAVLLTWFPGQEAGAALADVLLGVVEPGGRMPTTWPRRAEDSPVLAVQPVDGELRYDEGVFIGYRGWDRSRRAPLFGFGHGLGYTTWSYQEMSIVDSIVRVRLRNAGSRAGREVVQVYLSPEDASDPARPRRWLAGFALAEGGPGETVTVDVALPERTFQVWTDGSWRTVPGAYTVTAAHSLADAGLTMTISV